MKLFLFLLVSFFSNIIVGQCPIIPSPTAYSEKNGELIVPQNLSVNAKGIKNINYAFLKDQLSSLYSIEAKQNKRNALINFDKNENLSVAYTIDVSDRIEISYRSDADAFYAISSLIQLIKPVNATFQIQKCKVSDAPKFGWRGLHLDVSRHFFTVSEVKRFIDLMAFYKFNTFHWHLTDDQGWRIEIKKYPRLTSVGGFRDSTVIGHYNDTPRKYRVEKYGGGYTQDEIKEVVDYAATKFVTVVPEIELPGHARAAIAAYPELSCNEVFLPVPGLWGIFEDVFCSKPETINFLKNVLDEVVELFPSEYIHIGGDEAPKNRWNNCSKCQKVMKQNQLNDAHALQSHFIQQIDDYLTSKGKKLIGWDEIMEGGLSTNAAVMSWRGEAGGIEAARQKHNVVMSPTTYCYFDYYQSGNATEPLAIGGYLPLEKVYEYNVIPSELEKSAYPFILGGQANVWTEYIPTFEQVEYMTYPRALALIQALWCENKPDYDSFLTVFTEHQEKILSRMGVHYSQSVYFPKLSVNRIENGVKYNFVSKKNEAIALTQGFEVLDSLEGVYLNRKIEGTGVEVNRLDSIIQGAFDIRLKSENLNEEIKYHFINHKGLGLNVDLLTKPHNKYSNGGDLTLVDGALGARPWKGDQWLGFDTSKVEIVVRFEEMEQVNELIVGFLDANGSWIYLPETMSISYQNKDDMWVPLFKITIESEYQKTAFNIQAKAIKLFIESLDEIPEGKEGAGFQPWTFIDEIMIK